MTGVQTCALPICTGCFDEITYNIIETDSLHTQNADQLSESYRLDINMTPAKANVVGLGMRYDTEEGAKALYTADMDRVNKLMADLDKELAGIKNGR